MKRQFRAAVVCVLSLAGAVEAAEVPNTQRFAPTGAFFSVIIPPGWTSSLVTNNFDIIEYLAFNPLNRQQNFSITEFKRAVRPEKIVEMIAKSEEAKGLSGSYSPPLLVDHPIEGTLLATIQVSTGTTPQFQHFYFLPALRLTMFIEVSRDPGPSPEFSGVLNSFQEKENATTDAAAQTAATSERPPLSKPFGLLFAAAALSYSFLRRTFQTQINELPPKGILE